MAEFPTLGQHCSMVTCKQLDFLPFTCPNCNKVFCRDHFSYINHNCDIDKPNCKEASSSPSILQHCSLTDCANTELTDVICKHCNKNFCLTHRHQQDHKCDAQLKEAPPHLPKTTELVKNILEKQASNSKPKSTMSKKASSTAAKVQLMKLKMKAEGDTGIPQTERIYFDVVMPKQKDLPSRPLFYSNRWTVGKAVDYTASFIKLENRNNDTTAKKLCFYTNRGEPPLEMSLMLKDAEADGVLNSGDSLILEYSE